MKNSCPTAKDIKQNIWDSLFRFGVFPKETKFPMEKETVIKKMDELYRVVCVGIDQCFQGSPSKEAV